MCAVAEGRRWRWLHLGPLWTLFQGQEGSESGRRRTTSASSPRVLSASRAAVRSPAPALPGEQEPGSCGSPPGRPPPRPPASSPSGPEGATGQRGPESGPGCVGGGALLPRASCARVSAAPAGAVAPSATARLPGGRARAPGGSRAPSAWGGGGGSGAGSRRKHPAT